VGKRLRKPYVNVVVGRSIPDSVRRAYNRDEQLRLLLHDPKANVAFDFKQIERTVGYALHSLVKDLLDVAVVIFMSDQYVGRDENQFRIVSILMPVRHPEIWNLARKKLRQTVAFLTQDFFDIHFWKSEEPADPAGPANRKTNQCVSLLSGGLDSFSGAKYLIEQNQSPVFVSHYTGKPHASQEPLVDFLRQKYKRRFKHCRVFVSKSTRKRAIRLPHPSRQLAVQLSRSFLFLSLATSVAVELGTKKIFIFENGPIAINAAISESRINTRTAHPRFLQLYRELVKLVFGLDIEISNPFVYRTKGEVVADISSGDFRPMIRVATSCWQTGRVGLIATRKGIPKGQFKGHHCGECFPCILRRVAVTYAGLVPKEDDFYVTDIFKEYPSLDRESITTIADLLRFCYDLRTLNDDELFGEYPDLAMDAEGVDLRQVIHAYRRQADQVIACFDNLGNELIQKKFSSLLSKTRVLD
jgi:7-cyano-7-deazaguanine synthase in queuosine biosynthesis